MLRGGTPPFVPMWSTPHVRSENLNPYPFFPFDPRWGENLEESEFQSFCLLLRLAWASPRPGFLPADLKALRQMVDSCAASDAGPITDRLLAYFAVHPRTGLLYFPPQMKSLERLIAGENMYSLLWDDMD